MALETLEYVIHADGRVEEVVNGIKGTDGLELTQDLEDPVGRVVSRKPTDEQYQQNQTLRQQQQQKQWDSWSNT
ncbi:MAG: DUF2997 domain-containing protein [Cyanobacteria bacterium P01_E01_bin.48]